MSLPIHKIVVHCSATRNGKSLKQNGKTAAQTIDSWHKQRGFKRQSSAVKSFNSHLAHIGYMLNLFKLPTDFDKREVEEAAEYAFDICFKDWSAVDFEQLYDLLKSKIGIDKYLELERDIYRPFWQSFYVLPVKERKKLNSSQKYPQRLVRVYSY